ncbi:MAG: hypothetical protein MZV49_08265 [Rhodopseudomonas palustris]|nr:hypothetical protein [Rhodopseudomonas palustris]
MIVNKKFWDGLPADVRTQLDKRDGGSHRIRQRASPRRKTTRRWQAMKKRRQDRGHHADRRAERLR